MHITKVLWLLPLSLLLHPDLSAAQGASDTDADHQKAIEAHIRHSNHQLSLLLRSASMANIDTVLDSMDAIRQGNEACIQHMKHCHGPDASTHTAGVSGSIPAAGADSKL
ncbi:hypothetical protein D9M68_371710 [compost metagenome]